MAYAPDVLRVALKEAALVANSTTEDNFALSRDLKTIAELTRFALKALDAGEGDIPDDECRRVLPIHSLTKLGIAAE